MEKITEATARKLLDLFVYRENDGIRNEIRQPYLKNNRVCATDSYAMIRITKNYFSDETFAKIDGYDIKWPELTKPVNLSISMIDMAIENLPMVDVCTEEDVTEDCPDCDGTGNVEWEYEDFSGEYHHRDFECPVCDGFGKVEKTIQKPTGVKEHDRTHLIKIGNHYIKSRNLLLLHDAMALCGLSEVTIKGSGNGLISFQLAEGVDMLCVEITNTENSSYIEIIINN